MRIIAEVGTNHKGNLQTAKHMIELLADYCGVDIVKFQKRNNKELLTEDEYNAPHPNPENSYAESYGLHRDALEFTKEQHKELKECCEKFNVDYSCSVWDLTSAKDIIDIRPKIIKIPSAINNNFELINYVCDNFKGEIHISLGMSTDQEIETLYNFLNDKKRLKDTIFYHCVSDYPVKIGNIYLKQILKIMERWTGVKGFGFSGHHEGFTIDVIPTILGCAYIERHFTINKNWKGTDHIASLEPEEMRQMVRNIKDTVQAWKIKPKEILDCELEQREKLKRLK